MAFNLDSYIKMDKKKQEAVRDIVLLFEQMGSKEDNFSQTLQLTPPNTIISKSVNIIRRETDLPLEIVFFNIIHFLSAYSLQRGITIDFKGQSLMPDLHSIILAPSGSGKTYIQTFIEKSLPEEQEYALVFFPNPDTDAAMFENLLQFNNGFFMRDEFAQLLKEVNTSPLMSKSKDYLLRTYDNKKIEKTTKKDGTRTVEKPALTILGSTVDKTFTNYITEEMLLDGLAQRFSYFFATNRDDKKAIYGAIQQADSLKEDWKMVFDSIKHSSYVVSDEALKYYESSFTALLLTNGEDVDYSFFRRIHFKLTKYALLYHMILKKENNIIDIEDMEWADRIVYKSLHDLKKLLSYYNFSELSKKLEKAEEIKSRVESSGKKFTTRELISRMRDVKNSAEAKFIIDLLQK